MSLTCRYIDDLITLNSDGYFDKNRGDIYTNSPQISKENSDDKETTYLDLDIKVQEKLFHTKLYDNMMHFHLMLSTSLTYLQIYPRNHPMEYHFSTN